MNRVPVLTVVCSLALLAGCKTYSNLDKRPVWAQAAGAEIPSTHPQHKDHPTSDYMTLVSEGRGPSISAARDDCQKRAEVNFSKQVLVKVMAERQSLSKLETNFDEKGSQQRGTELVNETIRTVSKQFLSAMKALSMWDQGFVIDRQTDVKTNYCYGAFVIERKTAARQSFNLAQRLLSNLQSQNPGNLTASTAIDALRDVVEFELAQTTASFFGKKVPNPPQLASWRQQFKEVIIQEGDRLEGLGDQRSLEEALAYYETCEKLDPDGGWNGKVLGLKRRLPCLHCAGKKYCPSCNGAGGFDRDCTVCGGTKIARPNCPKCNASGEERCTKCAGRRTVTLPCPTTEVCRTCGGKRQYVYTCRTCNGSGQVGARAPNGQVQYQTCSTCRGQGRANQPCAKCGGSGQTTCSICGGRGQRNEQCPQCKGRGRFGTCKLCNGKGKIEERCNKCKPNGKVWHVCKECKGSKNCKVCRGSGHRN